MKKNVWLASVLVVLLLVSACGKGNGNPASSGVTQNKETTAASASTKVVNIGVAMNTFGDKYLTYVMDSMKAYEAEHPGVKVTFVDANNDSSKQISQIENFVSQKMDAIIVKPVDPTTVKPSVDTVKAAHIPFIGFITPFPGVENATSYIGSDSKVAGKFEMEKVAELLGNKGNIAILTGVSGTADQVQRTEANKEVVAKHPDMKVVLEGEGKWDRAEGLKIMENWLNSGKQIDALVANNDEMAIGAADAIKAAGKTAKIVVAGIDATPDALKLVKSGALNVTIFQDAAAQGKKVLEIAEKAAKGEQVEHFYYIDYQVVTKENVDKFIAK